MPIIIENLTHTYMPGSVTQFTALYDINLTVEDGEFFGIIGHTGSGKSTLIQQLNGLIQPTSGRVIVDGFDMNEKNSVPQEENLSAWIFSIRTISFLTARFMMIFASA